MEHWLRDLRQALRGMRRRPGAALLPIVTLALGIGVCTAVFTVFNAVLLEPPAYREPERLVLLWHRMLSVGGQRDRVPGPDALEYQTDTDVFEQVAFVAGANDLVLETNDRSGHIRVGVATANLFDLLGVEAALGRTLRPGEGIVATDATVDPELPGAILLEHDTWTSRFGRDPGIIGRTIRLSGAPRQVIGVLRPDFELLLPPGTGVTADVEAWVPLMTPLGAFRRPSGLRDQDSDNTGAVLARLNPDVSLARARTEIEVIAERQREQVPYYREAGLQVEVVPLHADAVGHARPMLLALLGAVAVVLLIACINVANILLARAVDRRSEIAVRTALGASRGRLVRLALTEAALLGLAGAGLGLLLSAWGVEILLALGPEGIPRANEVSLDTGVLGFALLATVGSTLLFGFAPALVMARRTGDAIRATTPRGGGGRKRALSRGLVVWEVALSFALLVTAGLLLRTSANLQRVDLGFEPRELATFNVSIPQNLGGPGLRARLMNDLERQVRELPGVESVGLVGGMPLGDIVFRQPYGFDGASPTEWAANEANFRVISSEFFEAMGTPLLAGRAFTPGENTSENERIAIVDAKLAARIAPDGNAVGETIGFPLDGAPIYATIVGVVKDMRFHDLKQPGRETIYVPYRQEASLDVGVAVRGRRGSAELAESIEVIAAQLGASRPIPVYEFRDMESYVARALAPTRFALALVSVFAVIAVCLALVGLFGVISYAVSRRTREWGLRMALGAQTGHIVSRVVGGGVLLAAIGLGLGMVVVVVGASALDSLLYGVGRVDPWTYAGVGVALLVAAALASWVPARRAAATEPLTALRYD